MDHFVGRDEFCKQLIKFCESEDKKLLTIIGLPGIGKAELLRAFISEWKKEGQNMHLMYPKLLLYSNATITFDDLAYSIAKELNPGFNYVHGEIDLKYLLQEINIPTLLVLKIAHSNLAENVDIYFWNLVDEVLRSSRFLKVIATACKHPDVDRMQHIPAETIFLRELDDVTSVDLLSKICPQLGKKTCRDIYQLCSRHGSPFFLRKIAAHIQKFINFDEESNDLIETLNSVNSREKFFETLIWRTTFNHDMRNMFRALEMEEQKVLLKLTLFPDKIPINSIEKIFDLNTKTVAKHLYSSHCILEKTSCGLYYQMAPFIRAFIREATLYEDESFLAEERNKFIRYHLQLLRTLEELLFAKDNSDSVQDFLQDHRKECNVCSKELGCDNVVFQVINRSFKQHERVAIFALKEGVCRDKCLYEETVDTVTIIRPFLCQLMDKKNLQKIFDLHIEQSRKFSDVVRTSASLANYISVYDFSGRSGEYEKYINILSNCIQSLQAELTTNKDLSPVYLECVIYCYLRRAILYSLQLNAKDSDENINVALSLVDHLKSTAQRIVISKCYISGVQAGKKQFFNVDTL